MKNETNKKTIFLARQSVSKDVMAYIKEQILSGELNPGDRIVETRLAKELGISQTPVREALRHLQGEGIIDIVPNKGPMVCTLDMKDVFEIYSLRSVIEGLAIRLTTEWATDEEVEQLETIYQEMKNKLDDPSVEYLLEDSFRIHDMIMRLSNHAQLYSIYQSLSFKISLINRLLGTKKTKQYEVDQHEELIEAVKSRNLEHAEQVMRKHIFRSYHDFIKLNQVNEKRDEYKESLWYS